MERELHFLNFVTVFCIGFYVILLCVLCCIEIHQGPNLRVFCFNVPCECMPPLNVVLSCFWFDALLSGLFACVCLFLNIYWTFPQT